ncbi:MAG: outer membrane beta-barrel protein [Acidobacteria bacterium]|nr:outer membrane beta-barrel protein [Acidobacteriota bacterium]
MTSNGSWSRLSFTVDSRWAMVCLAVAVLLLRVAPCVAQVTGTVQIPENVPPDSPIQLGPLYLTPTFALRDIGVDNNVFNDDVQESDFTVTPSVEIAGVSLFGPMRFTGRLNTDYVWFQKFRSERSFNNTVDLRFEGFFDRLHPWATGEFVRTRARQGLEIDVRAQRTAPTIGAGLEWVVGSRTSLAVSSRLARIRYAGNEQFQGANLSEQLDSTTRTYGAGMRFELTPLTMLLVDGEYTTARFTGESVRNNNAWSVMPRLVFQPDAFISGELMVGFKTLTPTSPALEGFEGVVTQGNLTVSLLDVTQFRIEVERNTEYSFDPLHPYYVQTGATVTITQQIGGPFDLEVSLGRYELAYRDLPDPAFGPRGTEQLTTGKVGVGYRLGETFRVDINGQLEKRRSIFRRDREYDRVIYYGTLAYLL